MDLSLWFLNGFESGALEQLTSGEVDGDEEEEDKERTRLHRQCEIKKRGYYAVPCASAGHRWLKRPPKGEKKRGVESCRRSGEMRERDMRERAAMKMN